MFQILGTSSVGWICVWWSTINIWCVHVLDMGVCASSGSVGFWSIIPAALRSQLRSHAHIWHSFPDMITIHLPLWVWLHRIFPSLPSGTEATFQKWTTHPNSATPTRSSLSHTQLPSQLTVYSIQSLSSTTNPLVQTFFLLSQLFVSADTIGSFGRGVSSLTSC